MRQSASVQQFVDGAGRLDIAFNNAGVQISAPLHEVSIEQWDDVSDTNTCGVFLAMKYQIPHSYQATKQAVQALVKSAALEYGGHNIRVNAILPGITDTPMIRPPNLDDATWDRVKIALGQLNVDGLKTVASPSMIATAVLGLAGAELGYLTGACVPVDGGIAAGRRLLLPGQ